MHYYNRFTYSSQENTHTYEVEVVGDSSEQIYFAKLFDEQQTLVDEASFSFQPDKEDVIIALGLCY